MGTEDRIRIMSRLAQAPLDNEKANKMLEAFGKQSINTIKAVNTLETISEELKVIDAIILRLPASEVESLYELLSKHSGISDANDPALSYQPSPASITCALMRTLSKLKYTKENAERLLTTYLEASLHPNTQIASNAKDILSDCAKLNLYVYERIGLAYHLLLLSFVERLENNNLQKYFETIIHILDPLFATEMEKTTSDYQALTIHFCNIEANDQFQELRSRALRLAKKLYSISTNAADQIKVVRLLNTACRSYFRNPPNAEVLELLNANQIEVLNFFIEVIPTAPLQVLQKIEHDAYWVFYHADSDTVREVGRKLEAAIASNSEYTIYKTLVGFEGIFHPWDERDQNAQRFTELEKKRTEYASQWVNNINEENWSVWQGRILSYLQTNSTDLATFPVLHGFLKTLAERMPTLMLRLLQEHRQDVKPAIIPIIVGLWKSKEISALVSMLRQWAHEGIELYAITKSFLSLEMIDDNLLKTILDQAIKQGDEQTLSMIMAVTTVYSEKADESFIQAFFKTPLKALTEKQSIIWVWDFWHRRDRKNLIFKLDEDGIDLILENLAIAPRIDHDIEDVLAIIAARFPGKIIDLFNHRIEGNAKEEIKDFSAIPYQLPELSKELGKDPLTLVQKVYAWPSSKGPLLEFYGGAFLKSIYPRFDDGFKAALLNILRTEPEEGCTFLLGVLRAYDGEFFLHEIVKEILVTCPSSEELTQKCYMIIWATGVVHGEFGFTEAYKERIKALTLWLDDEREPIRSFAKAAIANLEKEAELHRKRAEEDIALRKLQYGDPEAKG